MSIYEVATKFLACPFCGVGAGEVCRTKGGHRASYPHGDRVWPVQQIFYEGFHEGQRDVVLALDSERPWSQRYIQQIREAS